MTALAGLVVFLILFLFRPFGIENNNSEFLLLDCFLYGLVTFGLATVNAVLLPVVFPGWFKEEHWNVGKELLMMTWQILTVTFGNVFLTQLLYQVSFSWEHVLRFLWITTAVGIFPVALIILLKQQLLLKKYAQGAAELDTSLQELAAEEVVVDTADEIVVLTGENANEQLEVAVADLLFITTADNYIKVYYTVNGTLNVKVLRSTLKRAESLLHPFPQLYRCHRAYIVNLAAVCHVSGNAQGYKLHVHHTQEVVPVSRSLNQEITARLKQYASFSHLSR